eukprot:TRINITY_DN2033_c1_g1_i1.p1 TRINITY_DN2033_c1_g1~~TRINITY_DN2033_c1_g1_i1.p1  ORF type:complete len:172 (-),score=46.07 TRINITY_DN2033_c1_g1_i1:99-587(-)
MSGQRIPVKHEDRVIYEWEQSLDEVNIYINPPKGVSGKDLDIRIKPHSLFVGIKGSDRGYINEEKTGGLVDESTSLWTFDPSSGELNICLQKARIGEAWVFALEGASPTSKLSPIDYQKAKEQIIKERFQRENPGFDFSNAEFSGMAPDARTFMGGLDYNRL